MFCGTPAYTLYSISTCQDSTYLTPEVLLVRIDYIIGIHKYSGTASYPLDEGVLKGILLDMFVLLALLLHKNYLMKIGVWHFVRVKNDIYHNPSFKCTEEQLSEVERIELVR